MPPAPKVKSYKDRFVNHVKLHKVAYSVGAGLAVGITIGLLLRRPTIINTVSPVFNNDNSSLVNFGGHTTKIVKRMSDGKMWEKVTEAASEEGASLSLMSRHLNGHKPDVHGEIYKIVGTGTTG